MKSLVLSLFGALLALQFASPASAQVAGNGSVHAELLPPPAITADFHAAATFGGRVANGHSSSVRTPGAASAQGPSAAAGWNIFHATNCEPYYDGSTTWVYVFPSEGGYWFTNNLFMGTSFLTQCAQGNYTATFVTNTSTGYFPDIYTWSYR